MVWAGGLTTAGFNRMGKFTFDQTVFDADAEIGDVIDLFTYLSNQTSPHYKFLPQNASVRVTSAHATAVTDIISFKLQGSNNNVDWDDLGEVTDADEANGGGAAQESLVIYATAFPTKVYRYYRFNAITVGAGNTLRGYAEIW